MVRLGATGIVFIGRTTQLKGLFSVLQLGPVEPSEKLVF